MGHSRAAPSLPEDATLSQGIALGFSFYVLILAVTYIVWQKFIPFIHHQLNHRQPAITITQDSLASVNQHDRILNSESTIIGNENLDNIENFLNADQESGDTATEILTDGLPKQKLHVEDYTIGWICAIVTEHVAAQLFFDEIHESPENKHGNDDNSYVLGTIGNHNTVLAVLPDGEYGIASATGVAKDLLRSFPNIRIGLMVGVGGGAPSKDHDIRLGDVVVSSPRDGSPGVFQYDFGKTIQGQTFCTTGFLNAPPTLIRTAVSSLRSRYELHGHQLQNQINICLQKNPKLRPRYQRPHCDSDILYRANFRHSSNEKGDCKDLCGVDSGNLISRFPRSLLNESPAIHYGLIASANCVMKDAKIRDKLSAEKGVLCFEMEAAGLMNHFPFLVVRGICDYSDSHKNKTWQGYAAIAAAAYTRDLLYQIAPMKIEAEEKLSNSLSGIYTWSPIHISSYTNLDGEILQLAETQRDIAQRHLQLQEDLSQARLSEREQKCHQLFRLTTGGKDASYEWYKDRIEKRVEGTCSWFVDHDNFQKWRDQESGPLLVSADPGCGKSVLAKYLIDEILPVSATICYFFFKEQDQNTIQQALCALLHQLFNQKPILIYHALEPFRCNGTGLIDSTSLLWSILEDATQDSRAGPIIFVLDALDECDGSDFKKLTERIVWQSRNGKKSQSKLKYLLTSRPYEQIVSEFRPLLDEFPYIRIPGEEESDSISLEVNLVITYRINQLSKKKGLSEKIKIALEEKLQETPHRTYLWVYLIFDFLEEITFKKTISAVKGILSVLPRSVNEAYEQILQRSENHKEVRKALSIILAASRPLTIYEMKIAMSIDSESYSFDNLDLEDDDDFILTIRSWCGLFISIHHGKVYFIHQTAREFLLMEPPGIMSFEMGWHRSITFNYAHGVVAKTCVRYLSFFNARDDLSKDDLSDDEFSEDHFSQRADIKTEEHMFLKYSATHWGDHLQKAGSSIEDTFLSLVLGICDPDSKSYWVWFQIFSRAVFGEKTNFTKLMIACYFGHINVVKILPYQGAELESRDDRYDRTPLLWAAKNGHEAIAKLLIDQGAQIESSDKYGRTPLSWAARKGHEAIAKLLIDQGAELESKEDKYNRTPLLWAARKGHEAVAKLLIDQGAEIGLRDNYGCTPLSWAASMGYKILAKLLINQDAELESRDNYDRTPLSWAARNGHEAIVKLLINQGAEINSMDKYSWTPLLRAASMGHEAIIKLLIDQGAKLELKDQYGRTTLSLVASAGYEAILKLLIGLGATLESRDQDSRTPLLWAVINGHEAITKLLIDQGAEINSMDKYGCTPLSWAASMGHEAIVKLLIDQGAKLESINQDGRTHHRQKGVIFRVPNWI